MIVDDTFSNALTELKRGRTARLLIAEDVSVRAGIDRHEVSAAAEQLRNLAARFHASGATLLAQRAHSLASEADLEVRRREQAPWMK